MKELTSGQVRQMFLDFFKSKGHDVEPSASLIPVDDPSLLWINSGVATLKKYFDGTVVPQNPRITNAQKSIRTNDIENVGKTARHLTFFEMLGNFSVGDYFKKEAIAWAWELLTSPDWFGLDQSKLYVTVYPKDQDSKKLWIQNGVSSDHIYEVEDNFWDIGGGPCGPDTEVFFDRGQEFNNIPVDDPENYPGGENERYLEIWNIVFSELNHLPDGSYVEQPHKNIDTGMGLERVVSVFQHAKTNYETDLFLPIIHAIEQDSPYRYGQDEKIDSSFKIIADHVRTLVFAISDGAEPSNVGRGYVLRRLLRRAVLNGQKLKVNRQFLADLAPIVAEIMKSYYPELSDNMAKIQQVIKREEAKFAVTLNDGLKLLNSLIESPEVKQSKTISGSDAFKLFDTYGFPVELTQEAAAESGLKVDLIGYQKDMENQKERARKARGVTISMGSQNADLLNYQEKSIYKGYEEQVVDNCELDLLIQDEQKVSVVTTGDALAIFDRTPFYAEMGGQVGDTGWIYDQSGELVATVSDTKHAPNGQNMHYLAVLKELKVGNKYRLEIDAKRNEQIKRNHTATHLVDEALRDVLGPSSHQAGSLVAPGYLRFDFTSDEKLSSDQITKVEDIVNEKIFANIAVTAQEMPYQEAIDQGAVALFSEKYGDVVRVVKVGDYSTQLCGGDHVNNTAEIGMFKITESSGIGSGVRRIVALTGDGLYDYLKDEAAQAKSVMQELSVLKLSDGLEKVVNLKNELKSVQQELNALKEAHATDEAKALFEKVEKSGSWTYTAAVLQNLDAKELREIADKWRNQRISDLLLIASNKNGKASFLVAFSKERATKEVNAKTTINLFAEIFGGRGGGNPLMAVAGGKETDKIQAAIDEAPNIISTL
ncbi:alanine--tRNA ligase [Xylocopilactobacillus apicola]|uniref:Alanine--tRNA ligase n=1 Tax=Xylocopilactobacillus apicola TaxID=2932184 RepID=A0AAU9DTT0_9LACO|nr:alanine--tRNA ligase [Xylocopilactobacillus apicola]BDR58838.1 alanine--tRNA ligase [Xylocopilactobacillus apicola]